MTSRWMVGATLSVLVGLATAAGCASTAAPGGGVHSATVTTARTSDTGRMPPGHKCPDISPSAAIAAVDYIDFLMANGRQYIADLGKPLSIDRSSLRSQQLVVGCSFRQLNDKTGRETPTPAEGDAAFLLPGTVVYAIEGWLPRCRLAAEHDGVLHVYLAYLPDRQQATPDPCALAGGGTPSS